MSSDPTFIIYLKDKIQIVVFGLDGAGKRTLLQYLTKRQDSAGKTRRGIPDTIPTIGMNTETIQIGYVPFFTRDLGGQLQFRSALWEMYTKNSAGLIGLIYVMDVSDPARFPEVRNNLWRMLKMNHLKDIPLAIFANKVDIFEDGQAITEEDLANFMGINKKMSRVLNIFNTSAKAGVGIHKGINWLITEISKREQYTTTEMDTSKSLFESEARITSVDDDDPLRESLVGTIPSRTNDVSDKSDEDDDMLSLSLREALKILRNEDEDGLDSSLTGTISDKNSDFSKFKGFEDPSTPFIFVFPYPKGPPAASAEAIPIIFNVCPHCGEPNTQRKRFCPSCGADLTPPT